MATKKAKEEHKETSIEPKKQRKFQRKHIFGGIIGILVVVVILFLVLNSNKGTVVAKVNGEKIYKEDIEKLQQKLGANNPMFKFEDALNQSIISVLLKREVQKEDIEVTDEEVNDYVAKFESSSNQNIDALLAAQGANKEEFLKELKEFLALNKLVEKKIPIETSDQDLKDFYNKNKQFFVVPESVNVSHILVETEEEANDVLVDLEAGADLNELALEKSIDPSAKMNKGDLGLVPKGQTVPEFEEAAFLLEEGELSEPVKTQFGYHIIKLNKKVESKKLDFIEVKDTIELLVTQEKRREGVLGYVNELWTKSNIKIYS